MSTQNQGDAGEVTGVNLIIANTDPKDWGDIFEVHADVFRYMLARHRKGIQQPLTIEEIGRDVGIHFLTVVDALVELRDRGFLQVRVRSSAGHGDSGQTGQQQPPK